MELSWTTFSLEVVNFLVLVWILTRFLYRPVLEVIEQRRADIEKKISDAKNLQASAQTLKELYEGRLDEWNAERRSALDKLHEEIDAERETRLVALRDALEHEREKTRISDARKRADDQRRVERAALTQAARFAARLLEQAAGSELDDRLVELALTQLAALPPERFARADSPGNAAITVVSAFPLAEDRRHRLETALGRATRSEAPVRFEVDSSLLAGLRIELDSIELGLNLRDELEGFADSIDERTELA